VCDVVFPDCARNNIYLELRHGRGLGGAVGGRGRRTRKRVPREFATGLCQSRWPETSDTRRATIARPRPGPWDLVVKKGSRSFSRAEAGIPGPSSSTVMVQTPSDWDAWIWMRPVEETASRELTSRLERMSLRASWPMATESDAG